MRKCTSIASQSWRSGSCIRRLPKNDQREGPGQAAGVNRRRAKVRTRENMESASAGCGGETVQRLDARGGKHRHESAPQSNTDERREGNTRERVAWPSPRLRVSQDSQSSLTHRTDEVSTPPAPNLMQTYLRRAGVSTIARFFGFSPVRLTWS